MRSKQIKRPRWSLVLVLELFTVAIIINGFVLADFLAKMTPATQPQIMIDNIDYTVSQASDVGNGMTWLNFKEYMVQPELESEMVDNYGNMYAPDILIEDGMYKMWYGAQGEDGKDRIHYATSYDGLHWARYGVVIDPGEEVHANDPTVVKVNGSYYMFYTVATVVEWDKIYMANSSDGLHWDLQGLVLDRSPTGAWDSFIIGRPTVLYEDDMFKMWYDGMEADPADQNTQKEGTGRHVGYATSINGVNWTRYANNPIVYNSGAIDVENLNGEYIMVEESGGGVLWRTSNNETAFSANPSWLFQKQNTSFDMYGHVTPFILLKDNEWVATYTGAATKVTWNGNRISAWFPVYNISTSIIEGSGDGELPWDLEINQYLISQGTMETSWSKDITGWEMAIEFYNGTTLEASTSIDLEKTNITCVFNTTGPSFIKF